MMAVHLKIGDLMIALVSDGNGLNVGIRGAEERFLVDGGDPDAGIQAAWGDLRKPAAGDRIFDSGSLWQLYRDGADYLFRFASPFYGQLPYKECRFSPDFSCGEVILHRDYLDTGELCYPLEYPTDELLMVNMLAQGRGVEVHACGIEDHDGCGYLFVGESGAGKSTTARLWNAAGGVRILSDDRIILRLLDGRVWMYGTPWHGEAEMALPERVPLTRIFFLGRGANNELRSLGQAEAVARLMAYSFIPFYNPAGLDFSLAFFEQVTKVVPAEQLRFVPDERVVKFIRGQRCC